MNQVPSDKTGSKLSVRALVVAQVLFLVASFGVPVATLAALSAVVPGTQAPNPVAAGGTATYNVQVTNSVGDTDRGVSITSIAGLPTGAALGTSQCVVVPADGLPHTIVVTITTTGATPAGTSAITMTATRFKANSGGCNNGVNDAMTGGASLTVTAAAKLDQTISFGALADKRPDQFPVTVAATASSGLPVTFTSATPAVCTVAGTTVSYVANGTCTIRADQAGNATYNAAPQVTQGFTVAKGNQTIAFGTLADKALGDPDFGISATASSGLAVTFTSATAPVCTVSGTTVHIVAAGTCTIDADQAGNASWNAAPQVAQGFTVTAAAKLDQTISFGALADKRPDQFPVTVAATASSGLPVTFTSATPAVCTVAGTTVSYVANRHLHHPGRPGRQRDLQRRAPGDPGLHRRQGQPDDRLRDPRRQGPR